MISRRSILGFLGVGAVTPKPVINSAMMQGIFVDNGEPSPEVYETETEDQFRKALGLPRWAFEEDSSDITNQMRALRETRANIIGMKSWSPVFKEHILRDEAVRIVSAKRWFSSLSDADALGVLKRAMS